MTNEIAILPQDLGRSLHSAIARPPIVIENGPNLPESAQRIAIIFQDFAAGGTERIMVRLAGEWAKSRDVAIFCGSGRGPARPTLSTAVSVVQVSPAMPRSPLSRWTLGRKLAPLLRQWAPDVIVGPGNHVLPVILASGALPAPAVCKLSNPIAPAGRSILPSRLSAWFRRRACAPIAQIVTMSASLREEAASYLKTNRVIVINEPILSQMPVATRRAKSSRTRILFAGRLVAQKNVALALHAIAELPQDFTLTIVGDGPERAKLQILARRLKVCERVRFCGHVADITPFLAQSDMFLLPSRFEGYPAVLIEALAAGLPVVTTPCSPAMREIVLDTSFGKIATGNPISLAAAILALEHSDGPDPALLRPLLDRHEVSRCAGDWLHCLDHIVSRNGARG